MLLRKGRGMRNEQVFIEKMQDSGNKLRVWIVLTEAVFSKSAAQIYFNDVRFYSTQLASCNLHLV